MLKHVGRMAKNKRKVIVAYRVVPGEPENCIVVTTENLDAADHDILLKTVESPAGQSADEFANVMSRTRLPDGSNMLARFHTTGKMVKVPTNTVEMTPTTQSSVMLDELNRIIAEQKGVSVADLAIKDPAANAQVKQSVTETIPETVTTSEGVLTDEALAAQYRSQADALYKEAKRLREQAEELVPTKKKAQVKTKESV